MCRHDGRGGLVYAAMAASTLVSQQETARDTMPVDRVLRKPQPQPRGDGKTATGAVKKVRAERWPASNLLTSSWLLVKIRDQLYKDVSL